MTITVIKVKVMTMLLIVTMGTSDYGMDNYNDISKVGFSECKNFRYEGLLYIQNIIIIRFSTVTNAKHYAELVYRKIITCESSESSSGLSVTCPRTLATCIKFSVPFVTLTSTDDILVIRDPRTYKHFKLYS